MERVVIDTVYADQIEGGDYISVGGVQGEVLYIDDNGDGLTITIADEDEYGEREDIPLEYDDDVDILGWE